MLKLALPVIDVLPLGPQHKRLLSGAACYLAQHRLAHDRRADARASDPACALTRQRRTRIAATQMRAATNHRCRQCSVSTKALFASSPHHAPSSTAAPTP